MALMQDRTRSTKRRKQTASSRGGAKKASRAHTEKAQLAEASAKLTEQRVLELVNPDAIREALGRDGQGFFKFRLFPESHGLRLAQGKLLTDERLRELTAVVIDAGTTFFQKYTKSKRGEVNRITTVPRS